MVEKINMDMNRKKQNWPGVSARIEICVFAFMIVAQITWGSINRISYVMHAFMGIWGKENEEKEQKKRRKGKKRQT